MQTLRLPLNVPPKHGVLKIDEQRIARLAYAGLHEIRYFNECESLNDLESFAALSHSDGRLEETLVDLSIAISRDCVVQILSDLTHHF